MSVLEDALLGFPSHGGSAGGLVLLSLADLPAHGELPADSRRDRLSSAWLPAFPAIDAWSKMSHSDSIRGFLR
jgi:hypothetical protein